MFKFLRKYNKWILAVGGTLLMITFLIPFAFQELGKMASQRNVVWATLGPDGKNTVSVETQGRLRAEMVLIDGWISYVAQAYQQQRGLPPAALETAEGLALLRNAAPDQRITDQHWYLLTYEADKAGLIGGPSDAYSLLIPDEADAVISSLAGNLRASHGVDARFVQDTLAKARGVGRLLALYRDADRYSDRRMINDASSMLDSIAADLLVLQASAAAPGLAEPTEEQLAAQLAAYATFNPGEGPHGFGYRLPNRVQLEWMVVPVAEVRAAVAASDRLNPVELRKHWKKNEAKFGPPDPGAPVPEAVREDLIKQLAGEMLDQIARFAGEQLKRVRRHATERDGYLELPPDWNPKPLPEIAQEIAGEFQIPLPPYRSEGDRWMTPPELRTITGLGASSTSAFGQPVDLPTLAAAAREFGSDSSYFIQRGVYGPIMRGSDGSIYLWRLTGVDPARPPLTVDEVRPQLIADVKRKADYDRLIAQLDALKRQATNEGMLATALAHDQSLRFVPNISRVDMTTLGMGGRPMPTVLPVIGPSAEVVGALIDFARALPDDQPVSELPADQRTIAVPVPEKLAVLVAQVVDQTPLSDGFYNLLLEARGPDGTPMLRTLLDSRKEPMRAMLAAAFSAEALTQRHDFRMAQRQADEEQEQEAAGG